MTNPAASVTHPERDTAADTIALTTDRVDHPWWCDGTEDEIPGGCVSADGTVDLLHTFAVLGDRDDDVLVCLERWDRVTPDGALVERGDWGVYTDSFCDDRAALNDEQLAALDKALIAAETMGALDRPDRARGPGIYFYPGNLHDLESGEDVEPLILMPCGTGPVR